MHIIAAKPFRGGVGVLLMGIAAIAWEAVAPQCWINLYDYGLVRRHLPTIEGPEMDALSRVPAKKTQPRDPRMGGFGD